MARDKSIDALKGMAIALVVLGHAIPSAQAVLHGGPGLAQVAVGTWVPFATATNLLFSLIYSFHMPLFAFVSGLLLWPLRDYAFGVQLLRRVRGLLVPYFAWFIVFDVIKPAIYLGSVSRLGSTLLDAAVGRGGLWYLYALFISATVVTSIAGTPGWRWSVPASAVLVVGAAGVYLAVNGSQLPNVIYMADVVWIYPFVVLGFVAGSWRTALMKHRRLVLVAGLTAFLPLFYLRYPIYVQELQPLAGLMDSVGTTGAFAIKKALAYSCATAGVLTLFAAYAGQRNRAIDAQAWLGRKSLGIYAIHGSLMPVLVGQGLKDPLTLFVVALGISVLLTALIERVPVLNSLLLARRAAGRPTRNDEGDTERMAA